MNFFDWTSNPKKGNAFFLDASQSVKDTKDAELPQDGNKRKMSEIDDHHSNLLSQLSDQMLQIDLITEESEKNNEELTTLIRDFSDLTKQMEILYGQISTDFLNEINQ